MRTFLQLFVFAMAISVIAPSCVSSKKFNELQEENEALSKSLSEAQTKIQTLQDEKEALEDQTASLKDDIESMKDELKKTNDKIDMVSKELEKKEKKLNALNEELTEAFEGYKDLGLEVTERNGWMVVTAPNMIMYRSGSARINRDGRAVIDTLASVLENHPEVTIAVQGHTDNAKLVEGAIYHDNWDLSSARANAAAERLMKKGVAAGQVIPMAFADTVPAAEGDQNDPEIRKQNRRTEFVIMPDMDDLYEAYKQ